MVTTIGDLGDGPAVPFVSCVVLGPGVRSGPRTCMRRTASFKDAMHYASWLGWVGNLYSPMWSGWVLLDIPSLRDIAPRVRERSSPHTAWRIW
jgi:hypothetical protein